MRVPVRVATKVSVGAVLLFAALPPTAAAQSPAQPAARAAPAAADPTQAQARPVQGAGVDMAHAKATFQGLCSKCHDPGLATSERHDRTGWTEVVQKMYGFGLVASDAEVKEVIEYLAAAHPAAQ